MYCGYCGAKLEDGQQCTCQGAQQAAARQAAAQQAAAQQAAAQQAAAQQAAAQQAAAQQAAAQQAAAQQAAAQQAVAQQAAAQQAAAQQAAAQQAAAQQAAAQQAAAQQAAAQQAAASKPILTQEQKEQMQRSMAEAKESAKVVGKALWNSAKVTGNALLDTTKSFAGSAQGALSNGSALKGSAPKGPALYRTILMGFGGLHILLFFFLSYAKLTSKGDTVRYFAQMLGINMPKRLTGPAFIRIMNAYADWGMSGAKETVLVLTFLFALPVVCGGLIILLNCIAKQAGMITSIVLSSVTLLDYLVIKVLMVAETDAMAEMGYKMGFNISFVVIVALVILQIVIAAMGLAAMKKAKTAA